MLAAPSRTIRAPMTTILVVDDEPRITRLVRDYLESAGFAVTSAVDGPEALMRARTERPDLVILDLGLPRLDGLDVTRRLRQDGDVPIIMLTARDDETGHDRDRQQEDIEGKEGSAGQIEGSERHFQSPSVRMMVKRMKATPINNRIRPTRRRLTMKASLGWTRRAFGSSTRRCAAEGHRSAGALSPNAFS